MRTHAFVKTALLVSLFALFEGAVAGTAHATPNFPSAVQRDLSAMSRPACIVCHNNPSGGLGTVTTGFGTYMRSRGLVAFDEGSLQTAIDAARAEKHDSNGDGIDDLAALTEGLDPNAASGDRGASRQPPGYGCGGRIAPGVGLDGSFGVAVAVAFAAAARRRLRLVGWRRGHCPLRDGEATY
jgi:hypothetical protein